MHIRDVLFFSEACRRLSGRTPLYPAPSQKSDPLVPFFDQAPGRFIGAVHRIRADHIRHVIPDFPPKNHRRYLRVRQNTVHEHVLFIRKYQYPRDPIAFQQYPEKPFHLGNVRITLYRDQGIARLFQPFIYLLLDPPLKIAFLSAITIKMYCLFTTCDTVEADTPAIFAISLIVAIIQSLLPACNILIIPFLEKKSISM